MTPDTWSLGKPIIRIRLLYRVQASDPWSMGAATLVMVVGGLVAALIPARRTAGVDPMEALRAE
jgi:ABC-type lipoprotein release transport system permease subunit